MLYINDAEEKMKPSLDIFCCSSVSTIYSRCRHNREAENFLNGQHHDKQPAIMRC